MALAVALLGLTALAHSQFIVPYHPPAASTPCVGCVFETTFATALCPDWVQEIDGKTDANVCQPTDGIKGRAATVLAGHPNGSEINASGNYPGGAGGKGVVDWYGNGTNAVTGGVAVEPPTGPWTEFWLRWYQEYDPTFTWSGSPAYHKAIYIWGNGTTELITGIVGETFGLNYAGTTSQMGAPGWSTIRLGWHCFEVHGKGGTGNAISEAWVDNVQAYSNSSLTFAPGTAWGFFHLGENASVVSGGDYYVHFDDIAIKITGRIGCLH